MTPAHGQLRFMSEVHRGGARLSHTRHNRGICSTGPMLGPVYVVGPAALALRPGPTTSKVRDRNAQHQCGMCYRETG